MTQRTVDLDADLEIRLRIESMQSGKAEVDVIREALEAYLQKRPPGPPPGFGEFASGHTDTAERAEELLKEWGFGEDSHDRPA